MKLPLAWLLDYLPESFARPDDFSKALAAACHRWDLKHSNDPAQTLARLMTFTGFNCDAVEGSGLSATLHLDVLSNRPDAQCVLGLAREVAAILHTELREPPHAVGAFERGEPAATLAKVTIEEAALCPRYTARIIRGVKVGPSPKWMQDRLLSMGLQPRNAIVDVTNFICFEMNQPLHAFDLNGLSGRQIIVRRAKDKEPFEPLYDSVPPLTPETLVIADAERPRALAGVLGGKGSEVTPETTDILLESACFHPASTRRTVRRLKVKDGKGTDSSYRFERGVDIEAVDRASARAARLIVELAGGSVAPGVIDVWPSPRAPKTVELRLSEVARVFGAPIPKESAKSALTALGCAIQTETSAGLMVGIPSWRRGDLDREIDLIEEVARIYGFNHIPETTSMSARIPARGPVEVASDRLRTLFTSLGFFEAVTNSQINPKWPAPSVWTSEMPLVLDPGSVVSKDLSALRNSLLVSLLAVREHNQNQRSGEARLFELGKVYLPHAGARPDERQVLSLLDDQGFQALADAVLRIGDALEFDGAHLKLSAPMTNAPDYLLPGHACRILRVREMPGHERAENVIGWMGVVAPKLQQAFGLKKPVAMAELDLSALALLPVAPLRYQPLPEFPEVVRDVAIVVDEAVTWGEIDSFARDWRAHEPLRDAREFPRFLSVFRGKQAGEGKKSVAFSLVYRAANRTLTDDEVNAAHTKFQQALLTKFKATLRA